MSNAAEALQKTNELFEAMPLLRRFISESQIQVMAEGAQGEEREFFIDKMLEMRDMFNTMPKTHDTDGKGDDAIVYLHYFRGGMDWYITERDMEDYQAQAFGLADLGYGGELGYISIEELKANNIELDIHWTPKALRIVKAATA